MGKDTAWIDIPITNHYSVSFQLLGSRIVLVSPNGSPRAEDLIVQEKIRQDYLEEIGLHDRDFIELHDLKDWKKINNRCRKALVNFLVRESKHPYFRGFIAFNFDFTIFDVFNLFYLRKLSGVSLKIVSSYSDAENAAFSMMEREGALSLDRDKVIPSREYWHEDENYKEGFTLLNQLILYSEIHGEMKKDSIKVRFQILRSILYNASLPLNTHFQILDWKKESTLQIKSLRYFLTEQFKSNKEYNCSLMCIICRNTQVFKVFQTSKKLFPIPIYITDNFRDAIHYISKKRKDLPELSQGVFYHERFDSRGSITQEHFDQYVAELETYIDHVNSLESPELEGLVSDMPYDHPMKRAMDGIRRMKLKSDLEIKKLVREKNMILFERNRGNLRLLVRDILDGNSSDRVPQKVQTNLLNSLYLSHCAMFEITGVGDQQLMRCISDIHDPSRRTLVGHLLPSPLARFVLRKEFSSFSPSELTTITNSDENLIPYMRSFIQTRNFQYIFFMKSCHNSNIYLYLEIPNDENYPFSLKDVYDAVFEVYTSIHQRQECTRWDYELALEEFDNDREFLVEVVEGFFERSQAHLDDMEKAIENNDDQLLKAESHKLKGAAANLFAADLNRAALDLEQSAMEKNRSSYFSLFNDLKIVLERFRKDVNIKLQLQI